MDERNGRVSEMERNERLIRDIREAQDYLRDNPLPRMTEISRRVQRDAVRIRSAQDAYAYLKDNPPFRSIKDILMAADKQKRPEKALKKHIIDRLCATILIRSATALKERFAIGFQERRKISGGISCLSCAGFRISRCRRRIRC